MFQATIAVARNHGHEYIAVGRVKKGRVERLGFEQRDLRFANLFGVGCNAVQIQVGGDTGKHHFMKDAVCMEFDRLRGSHFDGVIDQRVVVGGLIHAKSMALGGLRVCRCQTQAGVDFPLIGMGGWIQQYLAGVVRLAIYTQKNAGAIEESMGFVEMCAAHRQVPRIHDVLNIQGAGAGIGLPGVIAGFLDLDGVALARGPYRFHLPGKIPNKIAAWDPGRHEHGLPFRVGFGDVCVHLQAVARRIEGGYAIRDRFFFHNRYFTL